MIIVLVREWFTLKCVVGGWCYLGSKHDSNFGKLHMKKFRFVLEKKGFIFSAIVKGEGKY